MKAVYPGLQPSDVDAMLEGTRGVNAITEDLGSPGKDDVFGWGLINANLAVLAALDAASTPAPPSPVLLASSYVMDFGAMSSSLSLDLKNAGSGTLVIGSVTTDQPWLSIAPQAVGTNTVTANRTGLSAGEYTGNITVDSNGGSATILVRVTVPSPGAGLGGGNIGVVHVWVLDAGKGTRVGEVRTSAAAGYKFSFSALPPGDYRIVAGTDLDGNGGLDDDGEAYGAYPVPSAPKTLHATADLANVDFPLNFALRIPATSLPVSTPVPR